MKKIIFLFAMVFAVSMAMAQNSSSISTTGDWNDASIKQGVANNNTASILQSQNGQSVVYRGNAEITQVTGSWGKITQYGTWGNGRIYENNYDRGETYQNGFQNNALISFNYGQGYNAGYIEQIGNTNTGYIHTTFHNNGTELDPLLIRQTGNKNQAYIESGWNAPASNYNKASITQTGELNTSKVRQEGGDVNDARVVQTGNSNHADLVQTGAYLVATINQWGGNSNIVNLKQAGGNADIDQMGNDNEVRGLQSAASADEQLWAGFAGATLDVIQYGNENTLDLSSTSAGAVVDVYQNGLLNKAMVIQE